MTTQEIYKIVIFDSVENKSTTDSLIFWDKDAAIREADELANDPDIPADIIYVYEEHADEGGFFRTAGLVHKIDKR